MATNITAKLFSSTYLQAGIGGAQNWDLYCCSQTLYEMSYADFVFKIRLDFSFQKLKILYLNPQPTDSQSGVITITPQSQLWVGDTEKLSLTFSHAWLVLVELTTCWFPVSSHNHYTTVSTVGGRHRKAFSNLQSCLTDSSWIHLILLIQLI